MKGKMSGEENTSMKDRRRNRDRRRIIEEEVEIREESLEKKYRPENNYQRRSRRDGNQRTN